MKGWLSGKARWIVVAAVVVALAVAACLRYQPSLLRPLLIAVVVIGLLWIAIELAIRWWKRKKQRRFDEAVAAKEGIADRKREWASWVRELEGQGVDRYELPFYLLVGEPQSGKSVLLQNSDLHFPFGQTRLSGVGGTRGCDWWFTDEAVILDLAGRLFTHEGGAADEAEWSAFLDLLVEFRPLCPANGILLVIPCDGLLEDSPEKAASKAARMQTALVALVQKLQARLPVYVVLTKGDKIFGFAESVYQLDAPRRHEMFGWSRAADAADKPFDLAETRAGFEGLVVRARLLRAEALANARIPEGLPQVDRLYAFPDEMRALLPGLEIYLRKIFTESALVERLSFRGLYLTSGLQSGVPIAKVCAQILEQRGQADMRALEALFTKQRAFFIKDLVRQRVFAERGLVRATDTRVVRARRTALIGYGVAAAISLFAIAVSVAYALGGKPEGIDLLHTEAVAKAAELESGAHVDDSMEALRAIRAAIDARGAGGEEIEKRSVDEAFGEVDGALKGLYDWVVDERLGPALRGAAARALVQRVSNTDGLDRKAFDDAARDARALLGGAGDWSDVAALAPDLDATDPGLGEPRTIAGALALRRTHRAPPAPTPDDLRDGQPLRAMFERMAELYDRSLDASSRWYPSGDLGYVIALDGLKSSKAEIARTLRERPETIHAVAGLYGISAANIQAAISALAGSSEAKDKAKVRLSQAKQQLGDQRRARESFWALRGTGEAQPWPRADQVERDIDALFKSKAELEVSIQALKAGGFLDDLLGQACEPTLLPLANWTLADALEDLKQAGEFVGVVLPRDVFEAKCRAVGEAFASECTSWAALREVAAESEAPATLDVGAIGQLVAISAALDKLSPDAGRGWRSAIARLLEEHFGAAAEALDSASRTDLDRSVLATIGAVKGAVPGAADAALTFGSQYVAAVETRALEDWTRRREGGPGALPAVLQDVERHLGETKAAAWIAGDAQHDAWLAQVDTLLAGWLADLEAPLLSRWGAGDDAEWRGRAVADAARRVLEALDRENLNALIAGASDDPLSTAVRGLRQTDTKWMEPLTATKRALDSVLSLHEGRPAATAASDASVTGARACAEVYVSEGGATRSGPELAALFAGTKWPVAATGPDGTPATRAGKGATRLAEGLAQRLRQCVLDEIRAKYLAELTAKLTAESPQLLRALRSARDDALADLEALEPDVVQGEIRLLLDANGTFDRLRLAYQGDLCLTASPGEPACGPCELDRFFSDLAKLMRGDKKTVEDGSATLQLASGEQGAESLWKQDAGRYMAVDIAGKKEIFSAKDWMKPYSVPWTFAPVSNKQVFLWWSAKAGAERSSANPFVKIRGPLAPLLLAWLGEREGDEWRVELKPDGTDRKVKLVLKFPDRAVPPLPSSLP